MDGEGEEGEAARYGGLVERDRGKEGRGGKRGGVENCSSLLLLLLSLFLSLSLLLPPCPVAASGGLFQEDADGSSRAKGLG